MDDLLIASVVSFKKLSRITETRFEINPHESLSSDFSGFRLQHNKKNVIEQTQRHLFKKLERFDNDVSFTSFRSMRMRLSWLFHTRTNCLYDILHLYQVIEDSFTNRKATHIKEINPSTIYARRYHMATMFPKLSYSTLRIIGYPNASFGINMYLSSRLGLIMMDTDESCDLEPPISRR